MKNTYYNCLKKLKQFRKSLRTKKDIKRGKLYFKWMENKTEKIQHEKNEEYIYKNILESTLPNYKIDKYNYERLNEGLKEIVDSNYVLKNNNYIFNNKNISIQDVMLIVNKIIFKRTNVIWIDFGFNIGNEFGGVHPAIILKSFDKELFVLPVSSKKQKNINK